MILCMCFGFVHKFSVYFWFGSNFTCVRGGDSFLEMCMGMGKIGRCIFPGMGSSILDDTSVYRLSC